MNQSGGKRKYVGYLNNFFIIKFFSKANCLKQKLILKG